MALWAPARALQDTKRAVNAHLEQARAGPLDIGLMAEQQKQS